MKNLYSKASIYLNNKMGMTHDLWKRPCSSIKVRWHFENNFSSIQKEQRNGPDLMLCWVVFKFMKWSRSVAGNPCSTVLPWKHHCFYSMNNALDWLRSWVAPLSTKNFTLGVTNKAWRAWPRLKFVSEYFFETCFLCTAGSWAIFSFSFTFAA